MTDEPYRHPLTPAQIAIIRAFAAGKQAKHIARERECSPFTVWTHVKQVKKRLAAKTLTHAVVICMRNGWL